MIIINKPKLQIRENYLIVSFPFSQDNNEQILWYQIPKTFQEYVVTESLDAALVALLFLALKTGSDITVNGPVSSKLIYGLNHYLINAISLSNPSYKKINVWAKELEDRDWNENRLAGTGLSCGVDSFASYYDHVFSPEGYRIEYFTFFNVGSHGDFGGEKARKLFNKRLQRVKLFAKNNEKEVIDIDSNLSEILRLNFQRTHTLRSVSCVLILQKLFKTFYYASSIRFDRFKLDNTRIAEYDLLNLQMLSTESTQFVSSAAQFTRVERIALISKEPGTYEHLDVCVDIGFTGEKINCSQCHKCIRTMITLDVLGYLENYHPVFYLEEYKKNRSKHIGELFYKVNKETLDDEVISLFRKENMRLPLQSHFFGVRNRFRYYYKILKKRIKQKVIGE